MTELNFTNIEILLLIMFFTLISLMIISFLFGYICRKIHNSYHKGYNDAKTEKYKYYKTIKEILDKYNELMNTVKNKDNISLIEIVDKFIKFKYYLQSLQK